MKKTENFILELISSHNKAVGIPWFLRKSETAVQIILDHNGLKLILKKYSYLKHLSCVFTTYLPNLLIE